jgi:polyisoprenoid-binding protein YceI
MSTWIFEPGHTEAEFRARHAMVTWVRGLFKDIADRSSGIARASSERPSKLDVAYLGEWETPFWEGDQNRGTMRRIGFEAGTRVDRHDFGVSWNDQLPGGGVVVSNLIDVALDVEAILLEDLEATGAIEY